MRTAGVVTLTAALALALSACTVKVGTSKTGDEGEKAPAPAPAAGTETKAAPAAGSAGSIKVVELVAGDKLDDKSEQITNQTTTFTPKSPTMYVNAGITGLTKGAKIVGTLRAVDVVTPKGAKVRDEDIVSAEIVAPAAESTARFKFTAPPTGWPVGKYQVLVKVDGQQVDTIDLTVAGDAQEGGESGDGKSESKGESNG